MLIIRHEHKLCLWILTYDMELTLYTLNVLLQLIHNCL